MALTRDAASVNASSFNASTLSTLAAASAHSTGMNSSFLVRSGSGGRETHNKSGIVSAGSGERETHNNKSGIITRSESSEGGAVAPSGNETMTVRDLVAGSNTFRAFLLGLVTDDLYCMLSKTQLTQVCVCVCVMCVCVCVSVCVCMCVCVRVQPWMISFVC